MTQVGYGVPTRVDGSPPLPPKYGLLQAALAPASGVRIVPDADANGIERWLNGVEVFPYPGGIGDVHDPCSPSGSTSHTKGYGVGMTNPKFAAMTVHFDESCQASHVWDQDEYIARALAVMAAIEGPTVAYELLSGLRIPLQPHLADGDTGGTTTFPNGNTATSVYMGLALLENEIAMSGRLGLIHCSPGVGSILRDRFAIDVSGGVLRTINGIVVIPDFGYAFASPQAAAHGYTPQGPDGHPAPTGTQEWMYATGPFDIRRSEMFVMPENVSQALDRGIDATNHRANNITYRAERYYQAVWDGAVHAAVLVDKCFSGCTS